MVFKTARRFPLLIALVVFIFVLLLASVSYVRTREYKRVALSFFSDTAQAAQISADVVVRGTPYRVEGTEVRTEDGALVAGVRALPALRLAYARAVAERSPLLGLPGVDPDELERAVAELDASVEQVAAAQATSSNAVLIASLYPLRFLATLPALERARQEFIASGSDADLRRYEERQRASIAAQGADIGAFDSALRQFITTSISIVGFGGNITSEAIFSGISNIRGRVRGMEMQRAERSRCFAGEFKDCDPKDVVVPTLPESLPASALSPSARAQAATIKSLYGAVLKTETSRTVVLSSSVCLAALPGPYAFWEPSGILHALPGFINDLYFQPINTRSKKFSEYLSYLADTFQMTLLQMNPMRFYMCPTTGNDVGRIRALQRIDSFAAAHPAIAPRERAILRAAPEIREDYALGYLRAALAETGAESETQDRDALIELSLMYRERSAGIEDIVSTIASVNAYHTTLSARGLPVNVSAEQLFLSHNAYPTLFLSQGQSMGTSTVVLQSTTTVNRDLIRKHYVSYSSLKDSLSWSDFIREIQSFIKSEGGSLDI